MIASLGKSISDTHVALCEKHKRNAWVGEQLVEAQEHLVAVKKEFQELKATTRRQVCSKVRHCSEDFGKRKA